MQRAEELRLKQTKAFPAGRGRVEFGAESRVEKYALFEAVLSKHLHYSTLHGCSLFDWN